MAINRIWMLGVAAAACLGGAWVGLSQPAQPEGCPDGGCRVGYRLEDGGIAPEGWEPYVTDDPVVALMDACLTYFMMGEVTQSTLLSVQEREWDVLIQTEAPDRYLKVLNYPNGSSFGTFYCSEHFSYDESSFSDISNWLDARFGNAPEWMIEFSGGEISFDQDWDLILRNSELEADVWIWNRVDTSEIDGAWVPQQSASIRFSLDADFHGPSSQLELVGAVPDIVF